MKNPKELRPVVKRLSRSQLANAGGGGVDSEALADCQKKSGTSLAPDRDILSDHGIWRLISGGNAAAAEWLTANVERPTPNIEPGTVRCRVGSWKLNVGS